MYIQVTHKMTKLIQDALPKGHKVQLLKIEPQNYKWYVHYDGEQHAIDHGDYDYKTGLCKVIEVKYPADYYAPPAYVTTANLKRYAKDINGNITLDKYKQALKDALSV